MRADSERAASPLIVKNGVQRKYSTDGGKVKAEVEVEGRTRIAALKQTQTERPQRVRRTVSKLGGTLK